ncbi:MAG TPA: hypothetical protein VJ083_09440, partial [Sedimentibacter sp.]|nr:hypothetical protein [Sedimentibacter sp.]
KSSAEFRDLWLNDDIREQFDNCLDKYQVIATHKRYYRLWVRWFISQGFPIKRTIDETLAILQPILLDLQEMNFFINNDFTKVYE